MIERLDLEEALRKCFGSADDHTLGAFDRQFRPFALAVLSFQPFPPEIDLRDVYQNAFIKFIGIFESRDVEKVGNIGFFIAVVKNCLRDEIRKVRHVEELTEFIEDDSNSLDSWDARLDVIFALQHLKSRCRLILEMFYIAGESVEEIAKAVGTEPHSIYTIKERCLKAVRDILQKNA